MIGKRDGDGIEYIHYDVEDVDWINVNALGGNDTIINNTDINMTADGGAGNDTMFGGAQAD